LLGCSWKIDDLSGVKKYVEEPRYAARPAPARLLP
jgi:hypothetical protein